MPTPNQHPFEAAKLAAAAPMANAPLVYEVSTTGYETRSHKLCRSDESDHEQWPSREGNRLKWRDGREGEVCAS